MDKKSRKGITVIIMLLMTISIVLKHAEDRPLPISASHMPLSLHPLPLPARFLSFSPGDHFGIPPKKRITEKQREKLEECLRDCNVKLLRETVNSWEERDLCRKFCKIIIDLF